MLNSIIEIVMDDHKFEPLYSNEITMEQIGYHKLCKADEAAEVIRQLDLVPSVNARPDNYQYTAEYFPGGDAEIKVYWPSDRRAWWIQSSYGTEAAE